MNQVYAMDYSTMKLTSISTEGKNNLEVGRVVYVHGIYVSKMIAHNYGVDPRYKGYGAKYSLINLDDYSIGFSNAASMHFKEEGTLGIHFEITDEIISLEEANRIIAAAEKCEQEKRIAKEKQEKEYNTLIEEGKRLFRLSIPETTKALIIAEKVVDKSDSYSDYFGSSTTEMVILASSTHTRDLFSEMRKAAATIPETLPLAVNNPEFEHREKWSMGGGYYLKNGSRHSDGWKISKHPKGSEWDNSLYASIAKRCVFKKSTTCIDEPNVAKSDESI